MKDQVGTVNQIIFGLDPDFVLEPVKHFLPRSLCAYHATLNWYASHPLQNVIYYDQHAD